MKPVISMKWPAGIALGLALCGCATTYPPLPEVPEYGPLTKTYDTGALCHLYPGPDQRLTDALEARLKECGYRLFAKSDFYAPSIRRPDWVVVPLDVTSRVTWQKEGGVLDTRVIVMLRRPGVLEEKTLHYAEAKFFQAWNRELISGRSLQDSDYENGVRNAVDHLFLIDEFRTALSPDADYANRFQKLQLAAIAGDVNAQFQLAGLYESGSGSVARNAGEAARWAAIAARNGHGEARAKICLFIETGVIADPRLRLEWLFLLADQDHPDAQFLLGVSCQEGRDGRPKNTEEALKWYRAAAANGSPAAMNNLALMYRNGEGAAPNAAESLVLLRKSAKAGYPPAQYNLGFAYEKGLGVEIDLAIAMDYYRQAAAKGNPEARERLTELSE